MYRKHNIYSKSNIKINIRWDKINLKFLLLFESGDVFVFEIVFFVILLAYSQTGEAQHMNAKQ